MNKRIMAAVLVVVFMLNCCGCSGAWRRKFVRKKKGEVKEEPVLRPEEYKKEFSNKQFYANHFAFWKAAESEFINSLKDRRPAGRINTYASYAIEELKRLHELLAEEKQKELSPFIEELKAITLRMGSPTYVNSRRNFLVDISSKHYRAVSRGFSYYSMKDYIIPEEQEDAVAEEIEPEGAQEEEAVLQETERPEEREEEPVKPDESVQPGEATEEHGKEQGEIEVPEAEAAGPASAETEEQQEPDGPQGQ